MTQSQFQVSDPVLQKKFDQIATLLGEINTTLGTENKYWFALVAAPNPTYMEETT